MQIQATTLVLICALATTAMAQTMASKDSKVDPSTVPTAAQTPAAKDKAEPAGQTDKPKDAQSGPSKPATEVKPQLNRDLTAVGKRPLPLPDRPNAPKGPRIDWNEVETFRKRFDPKDRIKALAQRFKPDAVDATRIPILLPDMPAMGENGRMYSFGDYYSISFNLPDATMSLTGNGVPIPMPPKARLASKSEGDTALEVQRTEEGLIASWTRFGVLYTAEVTCKSAKALPCRDEAFIRDVVQRHQGVVLGREAHKAAGH